MTQFSLTQQMLIITKVYVLAESTCNFLKHVLRILFKLLIQVDTMQNTIYKYHLYLVKYTNQSFYDLYFCRIKYYQKCYITEATKQHYILVIISSYKCLNITFVELLLNTLIICNFLRYCILVGCTKTPNFLTK